MLNRGLVLTLGMLTATFHSSNACDLSSHKGEPAPSSVRGILKGASHQCFENDTPSLRRVHFDAEALKCPEEPQKDRTNKRYKKRFGCTPPARPGYRVAGRVQGEFQYLKPHPRYLTKEGETFQVLSTAGQETSNALAWSAEVKLLCYQEDAAQPSPLALATQENPGKEPSEDLGMLAQTPEAHALTQSLLPTAASADDVNNYDQEFNLMMTEFEAMDGRDNPSIALPQTWVGLYAAPLIGMKTVKAIGSLLGYHYN
ncbi:MAG: hypothetical protein ACK5O7_02250 [Holosporales bacterium]